MSLPSERKLLLLILTCCLAGGVVWFSRERVPSATKSQEITTESLDSRLASDWEHRLAQLGSGASQAEKDRAAEDFTREHAQELNQQEQLADAAHSAPYLGRVEAISNHAAARVRSFDEVRRKLANGELSELSSSTRPAMGGHFAY